MLFANQQRMIRINFIKNLVSQAGNNGLAIDEEKLIYQLGCDYGTARRTALEYLKSLEMSNFLIREKGKIYLAQNYKIIKEMDKEEDVKQKLNDGSNLQEGKKEGISDSS